MSNLLIENPCPATRGPAKKSVPREGTDSGVVKEEKRQQEKEDRHWQKLIIVSFSLSL